VPGGDAGGGAGPAAAPSSRQHPIIMVSDLVYEDESVAVRHTADRMGGGSASCRNRGSLLHGMPLTYRVFMSPRWREQVSFLYLITPLCSYLYGGLYGGLYERAHIIRYFPPPLAARRCAPRRSRGWASRGRVCH
jgi:hypothetical protein